MTLRIGVDGHILTGGFQGTRTWLLEILRRAPALTPDTCYVVYSDDVAACEKLVSGPHIEHRQLPFGSSALRILAYWPYAIVKHGLDYLVTQYMAPPLFPARQIVVVHDILFETHPWFFPPKTRWRNRILVRFSAKRAKRVITVSTYCRAQIAAKYALPLERIDVVNNGFSPRSFSDDSLPAAVSGASPYFLFVGRLEPRKNLRLTLDAFALAGDPEARLVVVGRNDFEHPDTVARLTSDRNVVHLENVPDAELFALYRGAQALLFPSEGEGWGIPVIEALGLGCPVIASNQTAIPEAGGSACFYFDPLESDAVARLAELIRQSLRGDLRFNREAAARHAATHSWDNSAKAFAAVIRGLPRPAAGEKR